MSDNHRLAWNAPFVLLALVLALGLSAREISVGTSQAPPSLAEALLESSDGDTIVLAAGNYSGAWNRDLSIEGERIRIEGRGEVVIDLEDSGEFLFARGSSVELSGLRFQNASGYVVHVENGSLEAEDCDFAGAVYTENARALFRRCRLQQGIHAASENEHTDSLTLESCLLQGPNAVEAGGLRELRLLNCSVLAEGDDIALHADGDVLLNNTIVQGRMSLTGSLHADNSYAAEDLSDYGTGNLAGMHPGLAQDGALLARSPCVNAGNASYFQETDLNGIRRSRENVDIGARTFEGNEDSAGEESGIHPRPNASADHVCTLKTDQTLFYHIEYPCATFRAFGTNASSLESALLASRPFIGSCLWSYYDGTQSVSTTACENWAVSLSLDDFDSHLRRHSEFPDQFETGSYCFDLRIGCVTSHVHDLRVHAIPHVLEWSATEAEDHACAMEGNVPLSEPMQQSVLCKQSVHVPLGEQLHLGVEWTGGTLPAPALEDEPFPPIDPRNGCRVLHDKRCAVCGAERAVSPLPALAARLIPHRAFHFTPDEDPVVPVENGTAPTVLAQLVEDSLALGDREWMGNDIWHGLQGHLSQREYTHVAGTPGTESLVFRKICSGVTAWKRDDRNHQFITAPLACDIATTACGDHTFEYTVTTVGLGDLAVENPAVEAGEPDGLLRLVLATSENIVTHCIVVPAEISEGVAAAQHRPSRACTTLSFTAFPTNGDDWPTPDDHPLLGAFAPEELDEMLLPHRQEYCYPAWSAVSLPQEEQERIASAKGSDNISVRRPEPGCYTVTAQCHAAQWMPESELVSSWNDGRKSWKVFVDDLQLKFDGRFTSLPIILLNEDNDTGTPWGSNASPDLARNEPTTLTDDDLKSLEIRLAGGLSYDRALLNQLCFRVECTSAKLVFHADNRKTPISEDERWSRDGDAWLYRLFDKEAYESATDSATRQRHNPRTSCTLFLEGIETGTAPIAVSLVSRDAPNGASALMHTMDVKIIPLALVPDYNGDGRIDGGRDSALEDDNVETDASSEREMALLGRPLRMWRNANKDIDELNQFDFETGANANYTDLVVNGHGDLLDLFPIRLDLAEFLELQREGLTLSVTLEHSRGELNALFTDLGSENSSRYLTSDTDCHAIPATAGAESAICRTQLFPLNGALAPPAAFLSLASEEGKGIILCEGVPARNNSSSSSYLRLTLYVSENGGAAHAIGSRTLTTAVSDVSDMFRYANLRGCEDDNAVVPELFLTQNARLPGEPANLPDNETDPVKLFFVHGLNVNATESADWSGRLFKRLYQTGFRGRYVGVDWNGDEGLVCNYAENVEHAFRSAPYLAELVNQLRGNDKVALLAHSLGNMLVCSAIQDTELQTDFYGMLNAAVASEAFDQNLFEPVATNPMVPHDWREYNPPTWSALWHTHFTTTDRRFLTWKGRFDDIAMQTSLVNYYDSEDEVLGLKTEGELHTWSGWTFTGFSVTSRCYAWQKQEHAKGIYSLNVLGGTSEAGWGKEDVFLDSRPASDGKGRDYFMRPYTPAEANEIPESALCQLSHAVFRRNPASIDQDVIPLENRNHLLAYAFPALSAPAGCKAISSEENSAIDFNLATKKDPVNGWPRNTGFEIKSIWSHSDFIIVPYFYTHLLYENIIPRLDALLLSEGAIP